MGYQVGIDLGTTFTAAAVHRDGRSQIFGLGSQSAAIPSVVLLREDQTELTGEAAVRRALNEPERVAREFKRRLGDTTPIIVGGAPYSAEQLMSRLLTATITEIAKREGGAPDRVAVTHPANWGPYKIDLLQQAIRLAGIPTDRVMLLTEPEAAAISYATQQRVDVGEVVAVYDLGGGTFDAAVLRRTAEGFEIIGRPEGIERMGGIDFDAAVFAHVSRALEGKLQELDPEDPMVVSGVARLREECVDAKIALSSDTDATIPVLLPSLQTEVRITRNEFENLVRPSLSDSIAAMHRALDSAGLTSADVSKVLLVGGSSRIPLISQMVSSELGRPVAVDADPKHAIALGAAAFAGGALSAGDADSAAAGGAAAAGVGAGAAVVPPPAAAPPAAATPPPVAATPTAAMPAQPAPQQAPPPHRTEQMPQQAPPAAAGVPTTAMPQQAPAAPMSAPAGAGSSGGGSKTPLLIGALVAVLALGVGGFLVFGGGDDGGTAEPDVTNEVEEEEDVEPEPVDEPETTVEPVEDTVLDEVPETTIEPAPEVTEAPTTIAEVIVIDDATILSGVSAVVSPDVFVGVVDGVVTLSGQTDQATADAAVSAAQGIDGVASVSNNITILLADEVCSDDIQAIDRWACVTGATFDGTTLRATYDFDNQGELLTVPAFHMHFFSDTTEPVNAGVPNGVSEGGGNWEVWGEDQGDFEVNAQATFNEIPERLCVRIANNGHSLENLGSGNCFPVTTVSGFAGAGAAPQVPQASYTPRHICTLPATNA